MKDNSPFEEWISKFGRHFEPYTLDAMYQQRLNNAYDRTLDLMKQDSLSLDQAVSVVSRTTFAGYNIHLFYIIERRRKLSGS